MRAGLLSHTITLQRGTETMSAAGTATKSWVDFATIRAELVTQSVADTDLAYGEAAKASLAFRIRHFHGLSTNDRLIYHGQPYCITRLVEPDRRAMELHCEVLK
jgi:SPP1 family predicted phage head-tail adaptor